MSNDLRLFIGQAGGPNLYQLDSSFLDGALTYGVKAQSTPVAPSGQSADTILYGCYLSVTLSMGLTLRITPVVDGVVLTSAQRDVRLESSTTERLERVEVGFSIPFTDTVDPTVTLFRYAPRGIYVGVQVETFQNPPVNALDNGDLLEDSDGWTSDGVTGVRQELPVPQGAVASWTQVSNGSGTGVSVRMASGLDLPVVAGRNYRFDFQILIQSSFYPEQIVVAARWQTAGGTPVSAPNLIVLIPTDNMPPVGAWTPFSFFQIAPATAEKVSLRFEHANGSATISYHLALVAITEIEELVPGLDATGYFSIDEAELDVEAILEGEPERTQ